MKRTGLCSIGLAALLAACGGPAGNEPAANVVDAVPADDSADPDGGDELVTSGVYPGSQAGSAPHTYVTSDSVDKVIAWYRDKEARRGEGLSFSTERRDDGYFIVGNDLSVLKSFLIHLVHRDDGGTEVRLYPFDYLSKGGKL